MKGVYADTSALARAYLSDEPGHREIRQLLLEGENPVATSELTRLEFASAVRRAATRGRHRGWQQLIERFDEDAQEDGPIVLLPLHPQTLFPEAHALIIEHRIRTLDAMHIATAKAGMPSSVEVEDILFVTRDARQAEAATAAGLTVA